MIDWGDVGQISVLIVLTGIIANLVGDNLIDKWKEKDK